MANESNSNKINLERQDMKVLRYVKSEHLLYESIGIYKEQNLLYESIAIYKERTFVIQKREKRIYKREINNMHDY